MSDYNINLEAARAEGLGANWKSPDRTLLGDALPNAPALPLECFGNARWYIELAARGANAPVDYVAAMLLAVFSGLTGRTFEVRINDSWREPLIVWNAIVGPPSSGKTPACSPIRKALFGIQKEMIDRHEQQVDQMIEELKITGGSGNTPKEKKESLARELDRLEELKARPPRCLVNDSTVEALADMERQANRGLLVDRDELAGLISSLERYSQGVDRPFYLEAWQWGSYLVQRVKNGANIIENHSFSIAGGIQPDRLHSLLTQSGDDDGFMARLLVFWPDVVRPTRISDGCSHHDMRRALGRLRDIRTPYEIHTFEMSADAFEVFDDWYVNSYGKRLGTLGKIGSAYGKLSGQAARLAGLLKLLDWAFGDAEAELAVVLEERYIAAALLLVEAYFVPQIDRTYHGADLSSEEAVIAAILQRCRERKLNQFNLREARRTWGIPGARGRDATKRFDEAAKAGEKAGWIRRVTTAGGAKDFEVNPLLHDMEKP